MVPDKTTAQDTPNTEWGKSWNCVEFMFDICVEKLFQTTSWTGQFVYIDFKEDRHITQFGITFWRIAIYTKPSFTSLNYD